MSSSQLQSVQSLQLDDYSAAEPARKRLAQKRRFKLFSSRPNLRLHSRSESSQGHSDDSDQLQVTPSTPIEAEDHIELNHYPDLPDDGKNEYRWAALFENQRGITLFATAYYSSSSLLPFDPLAYTAPDNPRSALTPDTYPLPDGTWRWLSKQWMIDMRHEAEVQWDGFEYNWRFRTRGWRASAGAGGLVRRRMWVRLMIRPGRDADAASERGEVSEGETEREAPDVPISEVPFEREADEVWKGVEPEQDWDRCHSLMRKLGSDGTKLELWSRWLADHLEMELGSKFRGKDRKLEIFKQWSEDEEPMPSEVARAQKAASVQAQHGKSPDLAHVIPVLRKHGRTLLHLFVYPESRAELLALLARAGILPEIGVSISDQLDFWSYMNNLGVAQDAAMS